MPCAVLSRNSEDKSEVHDDIHQKQISIGITCNMALVN